MMDSTFAGLKWLICLVYLDDIIVWARSWEEHLERVEKVLQRCRERNLGLKATKSYVGFSELRILGHTVNSDGRFPDAKKVVGIAAIADPKNKAELATFLGMTGFYSEYIKDYASIAAPLNELCKASWTWQWTQECSNAVKRAGLANCPRPPRLREGVLRDARCFHFRGGRGSVPARRQGQGASSEL